MSVENQLRLAMLKTALRHLLKNREKSPERTARNIEELLQRFEQLHPAVQGLFPDYQELLAILRSTPGEECIGQILCRII